MLIRNISDTALLAAVYRARENEHSQALFRDPFARRLAGERGQEIAKSLAFSEKNAWSWFTRTYLFDQFINKRLQAGCDTVINLAAGLDARPYRLALPANLQWIEVDLPDIIDYKEELLRDEKPSCSLERVRLDLSNLDGRRELFQRVANQSRQTLIISEGLVLYLSSAEVASLATDLAAHEQFRYWLLDIASPALLKMLQKKMGKAFDEAAAPFKFAPADGPEFFSKLGWKPIGVRSIWHAAGELRRLPRMMSFFYHLQKSEAFQPKRPWAGACLLERRNKQQTENG
ncbi:MAG TPA: SAM-dependent methyltransferase [Pyrinomonadaceae bacterium]|jgi:methyltransferase (TIGR00027 family)|nr:SAM-dependent methyltransferase [Pyrinomonadaceae bacterium]